MDSDATVIGNGVTDVSAQDEVCSGCGEEIDYCIRSCVGRKMCRLIDAVCHCELGKEFAQQRST